MTSTRSSLGPVPVIDGISMAIAAERGGGWVTSFSRGGETIVEDRSKTYPWIGRYAAGRLANAICAAEPSRNKRAVREAIVTVFETIRSSPDAGALVSEPVRRVTDATVRVIIETSDPPVYIIELTDGARLLFKNRELATLKPGDLNDRWLAAHPGDALDATGQDFREIRDSWFTIAETTRPSGAGSQWEPVVEALQRKIAPLQVGESKHDLARSGLFLENTPDGREILWITSSIIDGVVREFGKSLTDSTFVEYLKRNGDLVTGSDRKRALGTRVHAWGFSPAFRPECEITDVADLTEEEADT